MASRMLEFLIENGVTDDAGIENTYFEKMKVEKYDDFEFFKNNMTEKDVVEMCSDCDIVPKNFVKKILNGWKLLRCRSIDEDSGRSIGEDSRIDDGILPKDVKNLLVANPITEKQVFSNRVVMDIYKHCYGMIKSATFFTYARDQREERYTLENTTLSHAITTSRFDVSNDGLWINVRKFSSPEYVPTHKTILRSRKTVEWIDGEVKKNEDFIVEMKQRKRDLYSLEEILPHRVNELDFLTSLIKDRESVVQFLCSKKVKIEGKLKGISPATEPLAKVAEQKWKRKRTMENKNRKGKDAVKRHLKSASNSLKCLGYDNSPNMAKVAKGTFGFTVAEHQLKLQNLTSLRQKMHLNGLRLLHEKGVFVEGNKLSNVIFKTMQSLQKKRDQLEEGSSSKGRQGSCQGSKKNTQKLLPFARETKKSTLSKSKSEKPKWIPTVQISDSDEDSDEEREFMEMKDADIIDENLEDTAFHKDDDIDSYDNRDSGANLEDAAFHEDDIIDSHDNRDSGANLEDAVFHEDDIIESHDNRDSDENLEDAPFHEDDIIDSHDDSDENFEDAEFHEDDIDFIDESDEFVLF